LALLSEEKHQHILVFFYVSKLKGFFADVDRVLKPKV
jgi:hypothetical protein